MLDSTPVGIEVMTGSREFPRAGDRGRHGDGAVEEGLRVVGAQGMRLRRRSGWTRCSERGGARGWRTIARPSPCTREQLPHKTFRIRVRKRVSEFVLE